MKRAHWILMPMLLLVPLGFVARSRNQNATVLLARYPRDPDGALKSAVEDHLSTSKTRAAKGFWLQTTYFLDERPNVQMKCWTNASGLVTTDRWVYNWAHQGGGQLQLAPLKFEKLRANARQFAQNDAPDSLKSLLILTFCDAGECQTRLYNRAKLPGAVREIYKLTGAPLLDYHD